MFAGIDASLNETIFSVSASERIVIGVITDANPPVNSSDLSVRGPDGTAIADTDTRITIEGRTIIFQNLMNGDTGTYTVVVMHRAGNKMLTFLLDICEFAVVCTCMRTDVCTVTFQVAVRNTMHHVSKVDKMFWA